MMVATQESSKTAQSLLSRKEQEQVKRANAKIPYTPPFLLLNMVESIITEPGNINKQLFS